MTVASILSNPDDGRAYIEFLSPETLANGEAPEDRFVHCGISWDRYLAFDEALGDDRSGPRFYYLDGELEVTTTSSEHERIKKWLAGFLEDYFIEIGIDITTRGQATMRSALQQAGAEPDESWCIGEEREFPNLVLEVALTSGGVRKLDLYRRFGVSEVWLWSSDKLTVFSLRPDGSGYDMRQGTSGLIPGVDLPMIERCVAIRSWQAARRAFRSGLTGQN